MYEIIEQALNQLHFSTISSGTLRLYARETMEHIAVVRVVGQQELSVVSPEKYIQERRRMEQSLSNQWKQPVTLITIVIIEDELPDLMKEYASVITPIYFVNKTFGTFITLENQPEDHFGLGPAIEQSYETSVEQQQSPMAKIRHWLGPVTAILFGLNVLIYIIVSFFGDTLDSMYMKKIGAMSVDTVLNQKEYYRVFSCMFLHFGLDHLFNNMVSLLFLGSMLEKRIGSLRFGVIYIASGIMASLSSLVLSYYQSAQHISEIYTVSAGASGAIFGVTGALIFLALFRRKQLGKHSIDQRGLILMTLFSMLAGFTSVGVDNAAHVGGAVFGFLFCLMLANRRQLY